jgi:hypothetical protein
MKYLIVGIDVSRSSIAACFMLEKPSNPRDDYFDADIEVFSANIENLNKLKAKIESFKADKGCCNLRTNRNELCPIVDE